MPLSLLMALLLLNTTERSSAQTFSSGAGITVSSTLGASEGSTVTVSGVSGTVINITLTLTDLDVTNLNSVAMVLVPPSSTGLTPLDLLSGLCNEGNSTFTLADSGDTGADNAKGMLPGNGIVTCPSSLSGTYLPSDWYPGQDTFNSPGPGTNYNSAGIGAPGTTDCNNDWPSTECGTYDFATAFDLPTGNSLNGTWTLYIANQVGTGSYTPSGTLVSWSISFTTESAAATTTSISANPNGTTSNVFTDTDVHGDSLGGTNVTLTATVTSNGSPAIGGTVSFYDSTGTSAGSGTLLASGIAVNGSGQAATNVIFSSEGNRSLSAVYSGVSGTYASSTSGTASILTVNHPYNPSGATFCNGPVTINDNSGATPYPSRLVLGTGYSQLSGTIESVTVSLNNFDLENFEELDDLGVMLQAPGSETSGLGSSGNAFEFLSWAGNPYTSGSLTFSDDGSAEIPPFSAPACTTCLPTDNWVDVGSDNLDTFPSPAPATFDKAAPTGSATFLTDFGGQGANNTWSLYVDNRLTEGGTLGSIGEWCLNFTMQAGAHPTVLSVSGLPNPASITSGTTASVTLTATLSTTDGSGLTPGAGTVTFVDGSTNLGTASVNASGVATLGVSLTEGTHQIVASYSGTDTGTEFGVASGKFDERVDTATKNPTSGSGAGPYTYCNTGAITAPGLGEDVGAAQPYPSNIFVTNLPGTVNATTVTLNGYQTKDQGDGLFLLVGPGGNNLDFFSLTGSDVSTAPSPFNLTFSDTAGSYVSGNLTSAGTFKPTSDNAASDNPSGVAQTYPQCPQNASDCGTENVGPPLSSNPFTPTNKAATAGTAVLGNANEAGVFGGTGSSTYNGNGTWSLYLDDSAILTGGEPTNLSGWCVNLTENLPRATVDASHSGSGIGGDFVQGESNAEILATITNDGPGSTGDPTGGSNPLKVVDTLNSALTYQSSSGTGWNCASSGQTVTCTNDSPVASGSAYPKLTLNVNVASNATSSISNSVTVSGAGITSTIGSDTITVEASATLAIAKSHVGTFTQGSTAEWTLVVSNTAAAGSTSGTVTVSDTLPTGYTLSSSTSTGNLFTCSGSTTVTCTGTPGIAAGGSNTISLTVNIPASSPTSVTNTASTWGGGDPVHFSSATAATGTDSNVVVVQVPSSISIVSGSNQTATVNTSFATPLTVVVKDAGGNPISGASVTFTSPASGASGAFSNSTATITANTNSSGQLTEAFKANATAGGPYSVIATAGSATTSPAFSLTNTAGTTTTAANQSANFSTSAQSVALSATVTSSGGTVNSGTVTFTVLNGATPVGTATTSGTVSSGSASVNYTLPASTLAGAYTIQAVYNGATDFTTSSDTTHTLTINGGTLDARRNAENNASRKGAQQKGLAEFRELHAIPSSWSGVRRQVC